MSLLNFNDKTEDKTDLDEFSLAMTNCNKLLKSCIYKPDSEVTEKKY